MELEFDVIIDGRDGQVLLDAEISENSNNFITVDEKNILVVIYNSNGGIYHEYYDSDYESYGICDEDIFNILDEKKRG